MEQILSTWALWGLTEGCCLLQAGSTAWPELGTGLPSWQVHGWMDGWTGSSLPPSPTHPDRMPLGMSNALLPPSSSPSPLGIRAEHTRTRPTPLPRVSHDSEILLDHFLCQQEARQGCEDVGQQEVPWDRGDSAVGALGMCWRPGGRARSLGSLAELNTKFVKSQRSQSKPNLKHGAKQLVISSTGIE